ncbi:PhzF family phenazine biosynthesis protein, partial [Vibrio vulnificus]
FIFLLLGGSKAHDYRTLLFLCSEVSHFVLESKPDDMRFKQLSKYHALIVTAANGENGYVLRYFAPKIGISEDLATGSAQCSLAPYWFDRLDSDSLEVQQLSSSGGYFGVRRISGDSIVLLANAKLRK